jgi:hypothetical protein
LSNLVDHPVRSYRGGSAAFLWSRPPRLSQAGSSPARKIDFLCKAHQGACIRPGGVVAFHEHFPDPDFVKPGDLRSKVEKEAFSFHRQFGSSWNYTALFTKPRRMQ